jgi:hypothetical protein
MWVPPVRSKFVFKMYFVDSISEAGFDSSLNARSASWNDLQTSEFTGHTGRRHDYRDTGSHPVTTCKFTTVIVGKSVFQTRKIPFVNKRHYIHGRFVRFYRVVVVNHGRRIGWSLTAVDTQRVPLFFLQWWMFLSERKLRPPFNCQGHNRYPELTFKYFKENVFHLCMYLCTI